MQSGGGPLQPGPSVMRGLGSGTPTSSQQQSDMQKMQSQPPLMNQPYQPPNMFRSAGANQNTRPPRAMVPYGTTFIQPIPYPIPFNPRINQWTNYGSMPGMAFSQQQYYLPQQHIIANQHQQNRRNPGGENNLVNVNSNYSGTPSSNGSTNQLNPLTTIPQMSQVQMPPGQPPNQQSSPMTVSHDLLVMQQMHPPPPTQHTPQPPPGVPGGAPGQAPMDQHQPNPAQVNVGAPQPHHTMMPQLQLAPHLAAQQAAPAVKVNKKRQRGSRAIPIINPDTHEDVLDKYYDNDSTPATSSTTSSTTAVTSGPPPALPAGTGTSAPPPQSANYSTIPPNVPQVPLNPPVVDSEYDNYPPHPHQGTPELPGGMLLHHQAPPHLHHPPPNHPPPPTHVHPVPGQMYDMGRSQAGQQQQHELVYTGLKTVNPPPHLPPPPHHGVVPNVVPTAAEMTTASGTPVVSANANAPSVEIKPYQQKKKKPISEPPPQQVILQQPPPSVQQPPPPQHPLQHHLPANINQPPPSMTDTMPNPYSGVVPERYRTFSEKSIAESTLSTDAEPFVYTGPTSINHHQQQQQPRLEEMPQQQQPVVIVPEVPPPMVVVPMVVPEQQQMPPPQQQQQEIPVTLNTTEVVVEDKRTVTAVDTLVASVEKLSVEDQPAETVGGGHNNNRKNKQQHKKRTEEASSSSSASETSSISNKDSGSSKAPATTATTTVATVVVEQQKPEPVDETDRSAVVSVVKEPHQQSQQSSSSSLISNLVEHNTSKLDNDNINNNVDCTSTTITTKTDTTTTENNNVVAASPMESAKQMLQPSSTPPKMLVDGENNVQQPEFDANKNVVMATVESTVPSVAPSKESTPAPTEQQPALAPEPSPEPQTAATLKAPAAATAAAPIKKSRSLNLIEYDPGQWSPDNPTGRKKYSRDQLLQLKNSAPAREKPLNLPNCLERSNHSGGHSMGVSYGKSNFAEMTLLPNFMKGMVGGGNMNQMRQPYPPKRPSQQGNQSGSQPNKHSQQGMSKTGSKIIRLQLDEEVKLNECENAWRPSHLQQNENVDDAVKKTQELFKKFRSVLNKLTPDNFDKLVQQVKSFVIDTDDRLDGCIKLVFEKAISEPNFSEAYAKMCKEIGTIAIVTSSTGDKRTSFKGRLLAQCQAEFEKRRNDQTCAIRDNRIKLEANKNLAKQEFEELKAQLEEEEQKVRRRAVGTVRFIGELYKHGQLTSSIMHSCIKLLIEKDSRDYDEETLECLCKLLTTIGFKMEKENSQDLSPYFDKMGEIVRNKDKYRISSRIRFMIQDVIDLRRNGWQPRRQDQNPKTMNQIQKEAETEQLQMSYLPRGGGEMGRGGRGNMQGGGGSKMSGSMGSGGYGQGSLGRGGNQGSMKGGRMQTDDDGFQQISNNRNNRQQQLQIDPKKINIPSNLDVTARLGSAASYQGWKNNSNMFAALNNEENQSGGGGGGGGSSMMDRDGDRDRDRRDRDRGGDRDRDRNQRDRDRDRDRDRSGSHNKNSGSYHKGSMERERYNRYGSSSSQNDDRMNRSSREPSSGSMRPMSGQHSNSQMHDRDRDRGKMPPQQQQQPPSMQGRSSQQRHIPQSTTPLLGKMGPPTSSGGSALTKSGSGQLYQQQPLPQFAIPKDVAVKRSFPVPDAATEKKLEKFSKYVNVEMDQSEIEGIVPVLEELDIKPEYYHAAINQLFMDNIERDNKSREMVAIAVSQMFEKKVITKADYLHALEEMFQMADDLIIDIPQLYKYLAAFYVTLLKQQYINLIDIRNVAQCILPKYGATMLEELLRQYENLYGKDETVILWYESSLNPTDFIKKSSTDAEKYLTDAKLGYLLDSSSKALDMETVGTQIKQFLKTNVMFMEIYNWIFNYVGPERVTSNEFIRTLTRAVIEHCIDNKTKLNIAELGKCLPILQKYIDTKPERELQALYAIQRLVVELEHPQNLLHSILENLYQNDVILEGVNLWVDSKDPLEEAGKGVCLKGITQFITMFRENSSDEDN